jgi:hypothetical protein
MDGDNFKNLTEDEIREMIRDLDMRIIGMENADRLGWEGLARLADLRAERSGLRKLLNGEEQP